MFFKPKFNLLLDIGSYSISAYAVDPVDGSIRIGMEKAYLGFQDGEWLDPSETIKQIVSDVIEDMLLNVECKIRAIYVGVPGEFTKLSVKEIKQVYTKGRMISDSDLDELYAKGEDATDSEYVTINCSPIKFTLDSARVTMTPLNMYCNEIKGLVSYTGCKKTFFESIDEAFLKKYAKEIKFVPTCWAEAIGLIDECERDSGALICDVGYISMSVMYLRGDGLLDLESRSLGGAFIAYDLQQGLKIPFSAALTLKPMLDFSINYSETDKFVFSDDGKSYSIDAIRATEIARCRLEEVAEEIGYMINRFKHKVPPYIKLYLTGGSLAEMRGAKSIVSNIIGRSVEVLSAGLPQYNRPRFASLEGLYTVQKQDKSRINFKSIFGLF